MEPFITPGWQGRIGDNVRAFCTTRHVPGWDTRDRDANLSHVAETLQLPHVPHRLDQVHGIHVLDLDEPIVGLGADAVISRETNRVCAVFHADCLPILWYDPHTQGIAAIHAGWRSLYQGVIEATFQALQPKAHHTLAWMGPAIGPYCFEVGVEVLEAFTKADKDTAAYFRATSENKWIGDLKQIARLKLKRLGFLEDNLFISPFCTYQERERFYSHRRYTHEGGETGRQLSLIYREPS